MCPDRTDLAKKPAECLEYIVVHELVHLLEPSHNGGSVALMDCFLPKWQFHRQVLNRLPIRRENWSECGCCEQETGTGRLPFWSESRVRDKRRHK
jgi:hypothetical protein